MLVSEYYQLAKVGGDVGVEIEVEGRNLPKGTDTWRKEADGSLKPKFEAAEYVLRQPVNIDKLPDRLKSLKNAMEASGAVIDDTYRAGIHVHVNVQKLTLTQLFNFILLHVIFEDAFLAFCRRDRHSNHFCLRSGEAEYFLEQLWYAAENSDLRPFNNDDIRYSALNVQSLHRYGSVEFRSLESTTDFDKVNRWAQMLVHLRDVATTFKDPRDLMASFSMHGYAQLTERVMGPWVEVVYALPNWHDSVKAGVRRAQDVAFCREWGQVNLNIFSKEKAVF